MEEQERQKSQEALITETWRERVFHALPCYTGPYSVSHLEAELPVDEPRDFSRIKRGSRPALLLDTAFSVYYLTDLGQAARHRRVRWLPRPRLPTCKGYAKFFSTPNFPVTAYIACIRMFTKLPAFRNLKLAGAPLSSAGTAMPKKSVENLETNLPVVMFSHGHGGSRTMYSTICGELASYGFVVIAMEHWDSTGARSYINALEGSNSPQLNQDDEGSFQGLEIKHAATGKRNGNPKKSRSY